MKDPIERDPHEMLGAVRALPDRLAEAWRSVRGLALPAGLARPEAVVVAGMGGSAIGGDLAAALCADRLPVPMVIVRDYALPAWVGPSTLVIAASFSGETEETLAAFADAARHGARRIAVTGGGALASAARAAGVPVVPMPPGGQPRAALGAGLAAVLGVLHAAGLLDDPSAELDAAAGAMRSLAAALDHEGETHPAARLAADLVGRLPIVWAPVALAPVARRWKTQLNENAKTTAAWDLLPELDHNTVAGWAFPPHLGALARVVVLAAPSTDARVARRVGVTTDLLREHGVSHRLVAAPRGTRTSEALWLVQLGDLTSVLLAYANGVDPTPVHAIARLKAALGGPIEPPP